MKPKTAAIFPFCLSACIYFIAMFYHLQILLWIFKPLPVGSLLFYFLYTTRQCSSSIKKHIVLALTFSMLGDIFLVMHGSIYYFIGGIISFLVAHLFYIASFTIMKNENNIALNIWYCVLSLVYFFFISILLPKTGVLSIPVLLYGITINVMLIFALHISILQKQNIGFMIGFGAVLFVISDSFIAWDTFYSTIKGNAWIVMATYLSAQFLLILGIKNYIISYHKI